MPPYELLERELRGRIPRPRFLHSIGVRDTAVTLAGMYGCDEDKAGIAGLLHDIARDMPLSVMQGIVMPGILKKQRLRGLPEENPLQDAVFSSPGLLHSYAGRIIARRDFDIRDENILRSIELHTTGGERMTILNKVVFVADYIEPGRGFRGVKTARAFAGQSLDKAMLYIFKSMFRKLVSEGVFICIDSLLGYNEQVLACMNAPRGFPVKQTL